MGEPRVAFALGGAACLQQDLELARALVGAEPVLILGTNHAGRDWPEDFPHWVTFHAELMPLWIEQRRAAGLPDFTGQLWTCERRPCPEGLDWKAVPSWAGSSGLLAVTVALFLGIERVICCGIPLDRDQAHYDDSKPWKDAGNYRLGWLNHVKHMDGRVRSWRGYTGDLLGKPDREWLNASYVPSPNVPEIGAVRTRPLGRATLTPRARRPAGLR